ncbi:MAG: DUF2155 domain-containing protein [Deltaproteobacteria bacterium]|nr:DUF2155 domain-containing protein [Deltaproteobacteria bacterium]
MKKLAMFLVVSASVLALAVACNPPQNTAAPAAPAEAPAPPQGTPSMMGGSPDAAANPHAGDDPHGASDPHAGMDMGQGMGSAPGGGQPSSLPVVVPDDVKAMFKSVKLNFGKKDGSDTQAIEVPVDGEAKLGDSGLTVKVLAFLPTFYMDQSRISSVGVEENNPAAKVTVFENGKEIHTGWLFSKMPTVHPFPHETYTLTLAEGVKAAE